MNIEISFQIKKQLELYGITEVSIRSAARSATGACLSELVVVVVVVGIVVYPSPIVGAFVFTTNQSSQLVSWEMCIVFAVGIRIRTRIRIRIRF